MRNEEWREIDRGILRGAPRVFGVSILVLLLVFALIVGAGIFTWFWAPWKGKIEQRNLTEGSGAYRIAAYDQFYDDCMSIVAKEQIIANYQSELEGPPKPDDQRAVQLRAAITAETNARLELIAEYNANARKEDTRGNFRASDLPYEIDPNGETSCTV